MFYATLFLSILSAAGFAFALHQALAIKLDDLRTRNRRGNRRAVRRAIAYVRLDGRIF